MPYPQAGESKKDYIARFMKSGEAQSDFPDKNQRLAVAYSMYEKRNSTAVGTEHPWPKVYKCTFIEPGVVFYQDLGECKVCGNAMTCEDSLGKPCDTPGETVLVKQDALARMSASFVGKPVIDLIHKDVTPSTIADGEADGIVTRVWFDDKSGWWMCEFIVWNPETQRHCESPAYSVSCAYDPTDVAGGGDYHSLQYQEEVKDGLYTHLAVVPNPRYEGARIFMNSKGGRMDWKFWNKKAGRTNAAPLDPKTTMVNVDGEEVSLQNLYDATKEPAAPEPPKLNDDSVLDLDGKERTLGELKQAYRTKMASKKNADEMCGVCKGSGKKPAENAGEEKIGEQHPLPDMRDPNANKPEPKRENDQVEDAAKAAEAKLKNEADEKAKAEKEAAEAKLKNDQAEEAAKKAEAEAQEKKALELQQAADKEKEEAAEKERRNAGRSAFASLRNAAHERSGDAVRPTIASIDDRLEKGRQKYGSGK